MINFRYHLVSLIAVFLALSLGIVLGVSVVDNGLVDTLRDQLDGVQANSNAVRKENDALRSDLGRWDEFGDRGLPGLLEGRLAGVPVLVLAVRGVDNSSLERLTANLADAGASVQGTVWLTSKLRLEKDDDVRSLATVLGKATTTATATRSAALLELAKSVARPNDDEVRPGLLAALQAAGFIDLEGATGGQGFNGQGPLAADTRFVVASGPDVDLPDGVGAIDLVGDLDALSSSSRTVAVEAGRPARGGEPEIRSAFTGPLRQSSKQVETRVSTVNAIEDVRGRVAAILALVDLGEGRVGHYGLGGEVKPYP